MGSIWDNERLPIPSLIDEADWITLPLRPLPANRPWVTATLANVGRRLLSVAGRPLERRRRLEARIRHWAIALDAYRAARDYYGLAKRWPENVHYEMRVAQTEARISLAIERLSRW